MTAATAVTSRCHRNYVCLSVRPPVCLSRRWVSQKRWKL